MPIPEIIALASQKGGSGKTTLATCLGGHWAAKGGRTKPALIDADPQHSLRDWHDPEGPLGHISVYAAGSDGTIAELVDRAEREDKARPIIIDTAGFGNQSAIEAMALASLVIIPVKPSPFDVRASAHTIEQAREISARRKGRGGDSLPTLIVLNMTTIGTVITAHIRAELEGAGLTVAKSEIPKRVAYLEAALSGDTPTHYQPRGAAAADIARLAQEIERFRPKAG